MNIIGRGKGWENAPRDELSWGITLTNLNRPVDLVIDMNVYEDGRWGEVERLGALKSKELALLNGIEYVDLSNYPISDVIEFFGVDYFTNTVDYAIALAIYKGFRGIHFYGINMANNTEYSYQKAGVEYWIGQAMGRGIKVKVLGKISTILKTSNLKMYGYDTKQKGLI